MNQFSQISFPSETILKYPSIGHLPSSRMGSGDRSCNPGQTKIATQQKRDQHDHIIVTEKLDGSNVGVILYEGILYPVTRAGNLANDSSFEQHQKFVQFVYANQDRFLTVLQEGDCLRGEWLLQAHGTRYQLSHEPFVAFDLFQGQKRLLYHPFLKRVKKAQFITPAVLNDGEPMTVEKALTKLGTYGFHGALDPVEGAVWRVERHRPTGIKGQKEWVVDFLAKYVRPDKFDGCYLPFISQKQPVWNEIF